MITTLQKDDLVYAYVEWEVVNKYGQFDKLGDFVYIQNAWISPKHRTNRLNKEIIKKIYEHKFTRDCKYVYWQINRDEYGDKIIDDETREVSDRKLGKIYLKDKLYKRIIKGDDNV